MRDAFSNTTDAIFYISLSGQVRARRSEDEGAGRLTSVGKVMARGSV